MYKVAAGLHQPHVWHNLWQPHFLLSQDHSMVQGRNKITKHVEREVICHSNFCHPHVIQFKEIFLTPNHLAIAMEYAPGGDMFQYVKRSSGLKVLARAMQQTLVPEYVQSLQLQVHSGGSASSARMRHTSAPVTVLLPRTRAPTMLCSAV